MKSTNSPLNAPLDSVRLIGWLGLVHIGKQPVDGSNNVFTVFYGKSHVCKPRLRLLRLAQLAIFLAGSLEAGAVTLPHMPTDCDNDGFLIAHRLLCVVGIETAIGGTRFHLDEGIAKPTASTNFVAPTMDENLANGGENHRGKNEWPSWKAHCIKICYVIGQCIQEQLYWCFVLLPIYLPYYIDSFRPNVQSSGTRDQMMRTAKRNWRRHPALPAAICST